MCADLLGHGQRLLVGDGFHLPRSEGFGRGAVVAEVQLGADQDNGDVGGVVFDFGEPLRWGLDLGGAKAGGSELTLALTLSKDGGLTIEKQIRKTSVCG
jgi:hypothetical protein